jgi:hypothetical protein
MYTRAGLPPNFQRVVFCNLAATDFLPQAIDFGYQSLSVRGIVFLVLLKIILEVLLAIFQLCPSRVKCNACLRN